MQDFVSISFWKIIDSNVVNDFQDERDTGYYAWVPMILAISALILLIPHQLWKASVGGLIKKFAKDENMKIDADNSDSSRYTYI